MIFYKMLDVHGVVAPSVRFVSPQVQYVSSTPATRADVVILQKSMDKALLARQARETGICPLREELYAQCFDELIRQCTIICAERGLLLLRYGLRCLMYASGRFLHSATDTGDLE